MARNADSDTTPVSTIAAPRYAAAWASLVYAISTLLLAYPALTGQFLLNPLSDQYKAGYAFREYAAQHLRAGRGFPQWNPFIEGGLPYIAAMHGDIFYPTFLLRMIMPTDMAMTWEFPIHLFLCGLFTYLFLRAWNVGFYGALVGGLAYMLGGSIAGYAGPGHDGKLFVSTLLPLALLFLTRGIRDGRLWSWGALAITFGLALLSPHPQLFQYLLLTCGAFALYLAFAGVQPGGSRLPTAVAIKRLAYSAGTVVLGILIGAVQYWPSVIEYKSWSPRGPGHDWETATSYSFPIEETLNAYWPQFSGILHSYWGRNLIHFHSDYFGVIVLILVGCAFGATGQKSFRRFWVITGAVALLWAFGGYTPFFNLIFAVVPGTKYFRAPSTIIYVTAFAVSVLAAIGMERLLARRVSPKYAISWIIAGVVFAGLMSVGGYDALSSAVINSMPPELLQYGVRERAAANSGAAIFGVWRSLLFVIAGAGLIWAFAMDRVSRKVAAIGLIAVLIVDLWSIERMYWVFSPRAKTLFASDPAIDAIKADIAKTGQPARVWAEQRLATTEPLRDPNFIGDGLMTHGLSVVGGYHGNELGMYDRLVNAQPNQQTFFMPPFWRHENVRYLYTVAPPALVDTIAAQLGLTERPVLLSGPVRNAAGNMVYAYRLPGDTKPATVATAMVKAAPDQALGTVLDPRFDPARAAIIDTSAKDVQTQELQGLPEPSKVKATVTSATDGSYDIALDQPAPAGSALVVSENYYPGWQATVDGKPAPTVRTNYNLIGVALPTGAQKIELRFTDAAYEKGKILTLVSLAIAAALLGLGLVVERRRPASHFAQA